MSADLRVELFVSDRSTTIEFYTGALGFEVDRLEDGYASLVLGAITIGLGHVGDLPAAGVRPGFTQDQMQGRSGAGVEFVLEVDDLDAVYERVVASGTPIAEPLRQRSWGLRDFRLVDPDGFYLRITSFD